MKNFSITTLSSNPSFGYQAAEFISGYFGLSVNYYRNLNGYYRHYWYS